MKNRQDHKKFVSHTENKSSNQKITWSKANNSSNKNHKATENKGKNKYVSNNVGKDNIEEVLCYYWLSLLVWLNFDICKRAQMLVIENNEQLNWNRQNTKQNKNKKQIRMRK